MTEEADSNESRILEEPIVEAEATSCDDIPDFAVLCSFLDRFGNQLGIPCSIKEVQFMLEQQGNGEFLFERRFPEAAVDDGGVRLIVSDPRGVEKILTASRWRPRPPGSTRLGEPLMNLFANFTQSDGSLLTARGSWGEIRGNRFRGVFSFISATNETYSQNYNANLIESWSERTTSLQSSVDSTCQVMVLAIVFKYHHRSFRSSVRATDRHSCETP